MKRVVSSLDSALHTVCCVFLRPYQKRVIGCRTNASRPIVCAFVLLGLLGGLGAGPSNIPGVDSEVSVMENSELPGSWTSLLAFDSTERLGQLSSTSDEDILLTSAGLEVTVETTAPSAEENENPSESAAAAAGLAITAVVSRLGEGVSTRPLVTRPPQTKRLNRSVSGIKGLGARSVRSNPLKTVVSGNSETFAPDAAKLTIATPIQAADSINQSLSPRPWTNLRAPPPSSLDRETADETDNGIALAQPTPAVAGGLRFPQTGRPPSVPLPGALTLIEEVERFELGEETPLTLSREPAEIEFSKRLALIPSMVAHPAGPLVSPGTFYLSETDTEFAATLNELRRIMSTSRRATMSQPGAENTARGLRTGVEARDLRTAQANLLAQRAVQQHLFFVPQQPIPRSGAVGARPPNAPTAQDRLPTSAEVATRVTPQLDLTTSHDFSLPPERIHGLGRGRISGASRLARVALPVPTPTGNSSKSSQTTVADQPNDVWRQRQVLTERLQHDLYNEHLQQLANAYTNERQRISFFDLLPDPMTLALIVLLVLLSLRFFSR